MSARALATKGRILDAAEELTLEGGFAGTSLDAIIERAGVTKGGFFYHFKSKSDLARALIERHAERDHQLLEDCMRRAERLSRDPLQQLLLFVGLIGETLEQQVGTLSGCLFASFCYEIGQFDGEIRHICFNSMLAWRRHLAAKIREAMDSHPPRIPVDPDVLADQFLAVSEGAFVLLRTLEDPTILSAQLDNFRNLLEALFSRDQEIHRDHSLRV